MSDQNNGIPPIEPLPQVPQPVAPAPVVPQPVVQQPVVQQPAAPQPSAPPPPPGYAPAGYAYQQPGAVPQYAPLPPRRSSVLSILSLIFGIVSVLGAAILFIPFVGFFLGLWFPAASVVLGFIARRKEGHARGMWLTGIILGFVALGLAILSLVLWTVFAIHGGFGGNSGFSNGFNSGFNSGISPGQQS